MMYWLSTWNLNILRDTNKGRNPESQKSVICSFGISTINEELWSSISSSINVLDTKITYIVHVVYNNFAV